MALFSQEIYTLINSALTELSASQASGRTPKNSLSEAHYLGAWVTTAIKSKRFDSIMLETLKNWQRQARSLGKNAGLKDQFIALQACYNQVLDDNKQLKDVHRSQLVNLLHELEKQEWLVTTDRVVGDRLNRHSGGKNSLIICANQLDDSFDDNEILIKPISLYIRGNQQIAIDFAFTENLLLYKKSDNKAAVKYHGEFLIYTKNDGLALPEMPISQSSKV